MAITKRITQPRAVVLWRGEGRYQESVRRLTVGVAVRYMLKDAGRGRDLGFRWVQDRVTTWLRPGREGLAEVAVVGVLGGDCQALPVGELASEGPVSGG